MTIGFLSVGVILVAIGAIGIGAVALYWKVKHDPEHWLSRDLVRLFELWFMTREPLTTQSGYSLPTGSSVELETQSPPARDRPTRVARSSRQLIDLEHGDHVQIVGKIYTVVAPYDVTELHQTPPSRDWEETGRQFAGIELHPMDDDPMATGGGFFIIQLSLDDGENPDWLLLRRHDYLDPDRERIYQAASAFGKSRGRDRTAFTLDITGATSWSVSDIATSRFSTEAEGGSFVGSVQVAHVLMRNELSPRDPDGIMVWFDYRQPDPTGSGGDILGIGSSIDPQMVQILDN